MLSSSFKRLALLRQHEVVQPHGRAEESPGATAAAASEQLPPVATHGAPQQRKRLRCAITAHGSHCQRRKSNRATIFLVFLLCIPVLLVAACVPEGRRAVARPRERRQPSPVGRQRRQKEAAKGGAVVGTSQVSPALPRAGVPQQSRPVATAGRESEPVLGERARPSERGRTGDEGLKCVDRREAGLGTVRTAPPQSPRARAWVGVCVLPGPTRPT